MCGPQETAFCREKHKKQDFRVTNPKVAFPRALSRLTGFVPAAFLWACVTISPLSDVPRTELMAATPFRQIATTAIWTDEPLSLIGLQRELPGESEQIVALSNDTSTRGDNFLLLVARHRNKAAVPTFQLAEFVKRAGGTPHPFGSMTDRDLRSGTDRLGDYFWLEYRSGGATNCVLAIRRVGSDARILPRNSNAMDVMLRNCVAGSIELALEPIRDTHLGSVSVGSGLPGGFSASRMMSPLAGPSP